jgi:hypothetical protein
MTFKFIPKDRTTRIVLYGVIGFIVALGISVAIYYTVQYFKNKNCCGDVCTCPTGQKCVNKKCVAPVTDNTQWSPSSYTALKSKITSAPAASKITDPTIINCIINNLIAKYPTPDKANADPNFTTQLQTIVDGCTSKTITDPGAPVYCKATCGTDKCNIPDGCGGTCDCSDQNICDNGTCKPPPDHWTQTAYDEFRKTLVDNLKDLKPPPSQAVIDCVVNNIVNLYPNPRNILTDENATNKIQSLIIQCVADPSNNPGKPKFNGKTSTPHKGKGGNSQPKPVVPDTIPGIAQSIFNQCAKRALHSTPVNCQSTINNCASTSPACTHDSNCIGDIQGLAYNYCSSLHTGGKKPIGGGGRPSDAGKVSYCYSESGQGNDCACKTVNVADAPTHIFGGVNPGASCASPCTKHLCDNQQAQHSIF